MRESVVLECLSIVGENETRPSIVVPVYRSRQILPELVEEIAKSTAELGLSNQFELLLVNDGSPDDSWQVIAKLAEQYEFVIGVSLRKNFGD